MTTQSAGGSGIQTGGPAVTDPGSKRTGPRAVPFTVRRRSVPHLVLIAAGLVVAAALVLWGGSFGQFNQGQLVLVLSYAIAIAGLNVATGYTGMISVGHSAFFGLGAYTTGILMVTYGWNAEATIPVAFVVCFVAGAIVGLPALKIRGLYLAVVTLAAGVTFPELIDRFSSLTGGPQGLLISLESLRPPAWTGLALGQEGRWLYWLSVALLLLALIVVNNIVRSRYGLAMMAARDSELAASASGVNLTVLKPVTFGLSSAITGVGGCLFAMYLGSLVADDSFTLLSAITLLTGLVIGGQGTRFGPIIGGFVVVYIPYYTSNIGQGESSAVLFGLALIVMIFIAPEGVMGGVHRLVGKLVVVTPAIPRPFVPRPRGDSVRLAAASTAQPVPDPSIGGEPVSAPEQP
jgi:branched-chain amino acid transport system permease protein